MCDICNILMVVPADQKLWFKCILGHSEPFSFLKRGHTPPEWASREKIMTRELVYYILSGTPKATQKCFWSNPRVKFLGENHLFLICEKMPNQTLQLIKYLDSGWNSDLFEKKNVEIRPLIAKLGLSKSGSHFQKMSKNCYL